jgi:hypothetical protein
MKLEKVRTSYMDKETRLLCPLFRLKYQKKWKYSAHSVFFDIPTKTFSVMERDWGAKSLEDRPNWDPPPPSTSSPASECVPHPEPKGGTPSPAGEGVGRGSQFRRLEKA